MQFYYRTFCQMAYHFGRQVGHESRIDVDYRKLAECFTLVEKNGTEHRPAFWELHPGSTASSAELGCTREETVKLWQKHTQLYGGLIPYEVHTASQKTGERVLNFTSPAVLTPLQACVPRKATTVDAQRLRRNLVKNVNGATRTRVRSVMVQTCPCG